MLKVVLDTEIPFKTNAGFVRYNGVTSASRSMRLQNQYLKCKYFYRSLYVLEWYLSHCHYMPLKKMLRTDVFRMRVRLTRFSLNLRVTFSPLSCLFCISLSIFLLGFSVLNHVQRHTKEIEIHSHILNNKLVMLPKLKISNRECFGSIHLTGIRRTGGVTVWEMFTKFPLGF